MSDKYFADTNILVYAFDKKDADKQRITQQILMVEGEQGNLTVSTQVLQEFFVTITRKLKPAFDIELAHELVKEFDSYPIIKIDFQMILGAIKRNQQGYVSFWDGLIIEAALKSQCNILLSEDMQDGQLIDNQITIRNPFKKENKMTQT